MPTEFSITRRVQFAETDMAGVMHFSNYFRWMEEVEHAFFRSLDMSIVQKHDGGTISFPRVRVTCEYFAPAHFEDVIEVKLLVTDMSEKSIVWEAEFVRGGKRVARGQVKMVCCQMDGSKFSSISIPDFIRAKLEEGTGGSRDGGSGG